MGERLTQEQKNRYKEQLLLPSMSEAAQLKLLAGSVVVLGLNGSTGTGLIAAEHLAIAGVGHIGLVDSNQELHTAQSMLAALNPDSKISCHSLDFDCHNADSILTNYQIIVDSLPDWQDKLLASDLAMQLKKPLIYCGITDFSCRVYPMIPGKSACLRCVLPLVGMEDLPPQSPAKFRPALAAAAAMQASAAIKLLAEIGGTTATTLMEFDALTLQTTCVRELTPRPDCPDCGRQ